MSGEISVNLISTPKEKPKDENKLGFGTIFTDHMFVMDYEVGKGWHNAKIEPYGPFTMDPSTMVLHYGQAIFEGMKAYRTVDGKVKIFRPRDYLARMNRSADGVCIPHIDTRFVLKALKKLVSIDKDWVPAKEGTSLYIRPFIIATDPYVGVRPSHTYKFFIILSPVGAYYPEGFKPVKIWVETKYVRTVKGGIGFAKTAANYAASLKAAEEAHEKGYTQVLWLDGVERKYIEEVGTMNIAFMIDNKLVTPDLGGSILGGMTRNSVIQLAKSWGLEVVERPITIDEVYEANEKGILQEIFGTGTAAVISPVSALNWAGNLMILNNGEAGETSLKLYDEITGIQYGKYPDKFEWMEEVE
ncbi:MAG: branched-chain amino acid aminotransferase [Thermincola sp.]|nr:branched-chain amino acid aminotransferase [Thermincola sp.]MDT3703710.1 branched-chain amino acid aminotransferase [Thermincola sp.]